MNESEERTGLDPRSVCEQTAGIEEDEPPGKPRRHPLWRNVPDHQWNDWRWQSQNAIRSVRQLRDLLSFTPEELEAIGSLEAEYKTRHPAVLLLAHRPRRSQRSDSASVGDVTSGDAEPVGVRAGRPARGRQGLPGSRPDASLSRPRPAGHHARLHHVLPLLHAQTGHHGPRRLGRHQPQRRAHDRIRPRPPRDPRRHRLRRRSADAARRPSCASSWTTWPRFRTSTSSASARACRSRCRKSCTTRS